MYFQPIYLEELGASPIAIGSILSAVAATMAIVHIPAGHLADRIGRRKMLWAAWLFGTISTSAMALASSLPIFVFGMILYALTAFVMSPLNSYATAARGKWSVARAITLTSASFNAGAVLGPLIGGLIGDNFGLGKTYLFSACIFAISTLIIFSIKRQPIEPRASIGGREGLLNNRAYLSFLGIIFLTMFAMYLPQPLTPNFLQNQRLLPLDKIGLIFAVGSLGNVLLNLSIGRMNVQRGYLLSHISVALFALMLWRGYGLPWYMLGYFLLGGYRVARSLAIAQVRDLVPLAHMGLAYGITETVSSIAIILVSPIAGYLYEINPEIIYAIAIIFIMSSFIVSLIFSPRISTQTDHTP